ncbi:hypothetical protein EBI_25892 [Enterocytozoon bieneusi H348]|nr:hypothetical protein EBI_25892 [Enterocytozoon bieneusi H348]|eukprot:XP_002651349.1 hypothetical protein EBI_25892 [Enterocytozoon bieneusi H348]
MGETMELVFPKALKFFLGGFPGVGTPVFFQKFGVE